MKYDLVFYPDEHEKNYIIIKGFAGDSTLKGIVDFCHEFQNYNDLVNDLFMNGQIPKVTQSGVFKIHSRVPKSNTSKVYAKKVTFKDERLFYDLDYLQDYFVANIEDPEFIFPIINTHFNYLLSKSEKAKEHLYYIRHILTTKAKFGDIFVDKSEANLESSIRNFVREFSFRKNSKNQWVINFPNLMLLARVAASYERKVTGYDPNTPTLEDNTYNLETKQIKNMINHYQTLLSESGLSLEEIQVYEQKITELETELQIMTEHSLGR